MWYSVPLVGYVSVWLAGERTVLDLAAIGLLLYGGWFVLAGLRERRRRTPAVAWARDDEPRLRWPP